MERKGMKRSLIAQMLKRLLLVLILCGMLGELSAARKRYDTDKDVPEEQRMGVTHKIRAEEFGKLRLKKPRFSGPFKVGLCIVEFPDTEEADVEAIMARQTEGVAEYYKRYTFGQCWPEFVCGGVYKEALPLGVYTEKRFGLNRRYGKDEDIAILTADLRKRAFARMNAEFKRCPVKALVVMTKRAPIDVLEGVPKLRDIYEQVWPTRTQSNDQILYEGVRRNVEMSALERYYHPTRSIAWGDPLWPNSSMVLHAEGESSTMIHELGHVLGAPDFYHAPPRNDGVPGTPTCAGGPTGPLYCRYRYCGLVDERAYPMVKGETTITLAPRWHESPNRPLGVFIPTVHPHYLLHLEYDPSPTPSTGSTKAQVGRYSDLYSGEGGIRIYYINVTKGDPYLGHPDMAYTYREGDPDLKGLSTEFAYFREGDTFDAESDPANILPNRIPTGVEIEFGEQTEEGAVVHIKPPMQRLSGAQYQYSLLPIVLLEEIEEENLLPTSIEATVNVQFRGEPLLTEYGFVVGGRPNPVVGKDATFSLFHEERHTGRLLGLPPGKKLYVRAFGRNERGVRYSEQRTVTLPRSVEYVPPLLASSKGMLDESNGFAHHLLATQYKDGYRIGASSYLSLMRLLVYGRTPLDKTTEKKMGIELDRINVCPQCPWDYSPARMKEYHRGFEYCRGLVEESDLNATVFPENFDEDFAKTFNLKYVGNKRQPPDIVKIDNLTLPNEEARIKKSLIVGVPVMCIRQPTGFSSFRPALNTCFIDGFRISEESGETEYHIEYMEGYDLQTAQLAKNVHSRKSGWWPLGTVIDGADAARLVYWTSRLGRTGKRDTR